MKWNRTLRRATLCSVALAIAISGFASLQGYPIHAAESMPATQTPAAAHPPSDPIESVCDAQRAKALDPDVEIPKQFDKQYPSLAACDSYAAAADPDTPGPLQPIAFSHKHHAGDFQIACLYCHSGSERSRAAGVPSVELCMGCHEIFPPEYDEFPGIRLMKEKWQNKEPIEWVQIHRSAEFVKFRHNRHVQAGVECQRCHGPVQELDKLYFVPDPAFGRMPAKKLEMGWCISCHRNKNASQDCGICHY